MSENPATPLTVRMQVRRPKGAEPAGITAISDGTMPCPVPSPGGLPCVKHIPHGWTAGMGHGGGHFWISPEISQAMDRGHFDATAALAGESFAIHQPGDCTPECLYYGKPPGWPLPPSAVHDTAEESR